MGAGRYEVYVDPAIGLDKTVLWSAYSAPDVWGFDDDMLLAFRKAQKATTFTKPIRSDPCTLEYLTEIYKRIFKEQDMNNETKNFRTDNLFEVAALLHPTYDEQSATSKEPTIILPITPIIAETFEAAKVKAIRMVKVDDEKLSRVQVLVRPFSG